MSPERFFAPEMGGLNLVPYMQIFTEQGVRITTMTRVRALERQGNKIKAVAVEPLCREADFGERLVDQVVVENATTPLADLYFELKDESINRGEVDYQALIAGRPQDIRANPGRPFSALPDRRCRRLAQHPRRDLRRATPLHHNLNKSRPILSSNRTPLVMTCFVADEA